jgi:hypothetical protein
VKFITNTTAIILFINGKNVRVEKTDRNYPKIVKVFGLPLDQQEAEVEKILSYREPEKLIAKTVGFTVEPDGTITYKGEGLPKAFAKKVKSIIADGFPLTHFEKFWENLSQNPSFHVVNETGFFEFLEVKELPITEDGCFLAYRGVREDYWSISGDTKTKVIQGLTNAAGQMYNGIGEVLEVQRNGVCDDRNIHCASGSLHVGSLNYASGWANKLVVVKVNPADVVSVPNDHNCEKCRVTKFEVVADYVGEITTSVVDSTGNDTLTEAYDTERDELIKRVEAYLDRKIAAGVEEVTVRQIQNSFSPGYKTKAQILDALQELGFYWETVDGVEIVFI